MVTLQPNDTLQFILGPLAVEPKKAHDSDAGYDLWLVRKTRDIFDDNAHKLCEEYTTEVRVIPPVGYHGEVVPRSSMSSTGFMLANSIGIIDSEYRGEMLVRLVPTLCRYDWPTLKLPARLTQYILRKTELATVVYHTNEVQVDTTQRGTGGYGSTNTF